RSSRRSRQRIQLYLRRACIAGDGGAGPLQQPMKRGARQGLWREAQEERGNWSTTASRRRGCWAGDQSVAHGKKPRMVRGFERPATRSRELQGLVLAETEGFEPSMQVLPACSLSRG